GIAMRRRKLIAAVGLTVVVAVGAFVLWPRPDPLTLENCSRIKVGMSREEVRAMIGPPGRFHTGTIIVIGAVKPNQFYNPDGDAVYESDRAGRRDIWASDSVYVVLGYDPSGAVVSGTVCAAVRDPSLYSFLWRAKLLWRKWFP